MKRIISILMLGLHLGCGLTEPVRSRDDGQDSSSDAQKNTPKIVVQAGNDQSGIVGEELSSPLAAQIFDESNKALAGESVVFTVEEGDATLSVASIRTDDTGIARTSVTFGLVASEVLVKAEWITERVKESRRSILFSLRSEPKDPAEIFFVAGTGQCTQSGTLFEDPLIVRVRDVHGNVVPRATVRVSPSNGAIDDETNNTPVERETNAEGEIEFSAKAGLATYREEPTDVTITAEVQGTGLIASTTLTTTVDFYLKRLSSATIQGVRITIPGPLGHAPTYFINVQAIGTCGIPLEGMKVDYRRNNGPTWSPVFDSPVFTDENGIASKTYRNTDLNLECSNASIDALAHDGNGTFRASYGFTIFRFTDGSGC